MAGEDYLKTKMNNIKELVESKIRSIPDFPKKGILFRDITPVLLDPSCFGSVISHLASFYENKGIDVIAAIESRGFIFGSALAYRLNRGLAIVRKPGKLPYKTEKAVYELEYGTDSIEIHTDAIEKSQRVLLVDDLLATGGTMKAACELIERLGGTVAEIAFVIELTFLNGRDKLKEYSVYSIVQY
jgi:adenine phosphoribosyltransferase